MKKVLLLLLFPLLLSAQTVTTKLFTLRFDYPVQEGEQLTNTTFRVLSSTNIGMPLEGWTVVNSDWTIDRSNATEIVFVSSNKVLAVAPMQFFAVSASNEWGAIFSEVLASGPPRQGRKLNLR